MASTAGTPVKLSLGDRVLYGQEFYYYQPNGSTCYLYLCKADVGHVDKAVYRPRKSSVKPYPETLDQDEKLRRPKLSRRHPLTLDDSETEEAIRLMGALRDTTQ